MPLQEELQRGIGYATSKPAQRSFINAGLLVGCSTILFCFAAIASALFHSSYVPKQVVITPIHLQYGVGVDPFGHSPLEEPSLKTLQSYDISVTLAMPRSLANVERGNFMINLFLLDNKPASIDPYTRADSNNRLLNKPYLLTSRRAALFPYQDPLISLISKIVFFFYYILSSKSQICTLSIPMAENVEFMRLSQIPSSVYVEIQAGQTIQIHEAHVKITAQLRGLRWVMYHYRTITFIVFTFLFWSCELFFMALAWLAWARLGTNLIDHSFVDEKKDHNNPEIADTFSRKSSAKYSVDRAKNFGIVGDQPKSRVKVEEAPKASMTGFSLAAEGQGEDLRTQREDSDWMDDSGLGTSYSTGDLTSLRQRAMRL